MSVAMPNLLCHEIGGGPRAVVILGLWLYAKSINQIRLWKGNESLLISLPRGLHYHDLGLVMDQFSFHDNCEVTLSLVYIPSESKKYTRLIL